MENRGPSGACMLRGQEIEAHMQRFLADYERLRKNRLAMPALKLQREYGRAYGELLRAVVQGADWYAGMYIRGLLETFPTDPGDPAGYAALSGQVRGIIRAETAPGGLRDQWRGALTDYLNFDRFQECVAGLYQRIESEALLPYWRGHCHKGPDGVTRNSLLPAGAYWRPLYEPANPDAGFWTDGERLYQIGWSPVPVSGAGTGKRG